MNTMHTRIYICCGTSYQGDVHAALIFTIIYCGTSNGGRCTLKPCKPAESGTPNDWEMYT